MPSYENNMPKTLFYNKLYFLRCAHVMFVCKHLHKIEYVKNQPSFERICKLLA